MTSRTHRRFGGLVLGLVALATIVAGCTGPGMADDKADNKAPDASLTTSKNTGWAGEAFSFDARDSEDPDGNITEYRFDFGDGTKMTVNREDDARVSHTYLEGGEYTVTVTVFDNGKDQTGSKSDTATKTVAINQRDRVVQQVIYAPPSDQGGVSSSKFQQKFNVRDDADRFEVQVDLKNALAAGSSVVKVRVVSPDGDVLDEERVTLASGADQRVDLDGNLYDEGQHTLEVIAESGGATATGEIEIFYDRGYTN
jgi:PKD repeat protein